VAVPEDATVVIAAGPRRDYLPEELEQLGRYLDRGGDLLLLLEPESPSALLDLAAARGVRPLGEVVVDPEARLAAGEGMTFKVAELDRQFLVSGTLGAAPVFSQARPLQVGEGVVAFLTTSKASYGAAPGGARGTVGPLIVGAAVDPARGEGRRPSTGRLIVYGDADFATNGFVDYLGNKDLFVNSINWLARDEFLIATRQQEKEPGREQFFVTEAQGEMAFWLATVVQPVLFLAVGAAVLIRRRAR
jgi:hypothetical protein